MYANEIPVFQLPHLAWSERGIYIILHHVCFEAWKNYRMWCVYNTVYGRARKELRKTRKGLSVRAKRPFRAFLGSPGILAGSPKCRACWAFTFTFSTFLLKLNETHLVYHKLSIRKSNHKQLRKGYFRISREPPPLGLASSSPCLGPFVYGINFFLDKGLGGGGEL